MSSYRVDNLPSLLFPFYWIASAVLGAIYYSYFKICSLTCRFEIEGKENLQYFQGSIHCMWHFSVWPYLCYIGRFPQPCAALNYPAAYMKPIHLALHWMGAKKLFMALSGGEGRNAVSLLAEELKKGATTWICPDGPAGPAYCLKKGVLHLGLQSGHPILPLNFKPALAISLPTWDRKTFPLPFSKVYLKIEEPLWITRENFSKIEAELIKRMSSYR